MQFICRIMGSSVCHLRVFGRERLPKEGGLLLAVNHQSYLDPVIVATAVDREIHYMARDTLFRNPVFGAVIATGNAFPVDRDRGDVKGVKAAIERLKAGHAVLMFPEGTRTRDGRIGRVKGGVGLIASQADAPILPILIQGAYDVWPRHRKYPTPAVITVVIGSPFRVRERGGGWDEVAREIVAQFETMRLRCVRHRKK